MLRPMYRVVFICCFVLLGPCAARAWLGPGHMATGALAYDALERRDPQAVAAIVRIMQSHPDKARFDRNLDDLQEPVRTRKLFELMARWPDDARKGPYDHPSWHYAEKVESSLRFVLPFAFGRARGAFRHELALAEDPQARPSDRAVALCWVLHIVGDMHQPLHAGMWMSGRFPLTDAGGTSAWVRTSAGAAPETLHRFWDSAGAADPREGHLRDPDAFAARLEAEHPDIAAPHPRDPTRAFDAWVAESRTDARDVAYAKGATALGTSGANAPVLASLYVQQAQALAEERLALAGSRAAALLSGLR